MHLHIPWVVRASGARPSSLGSAWAMMRAVAALIMETSLLPVPAAMSISTILRCAHGVGCALCSGTTFPLVLQSFVLGLVLFETVRPAFFQPAC